MADNNMIERDLEKASQKGQERLLNRPEVPFSPSEKAEQLWGLYNEYTRYKRPLYRQKLIEVSGGEVTGPLSLAEVADRRSKRRVSKELIEQTIGQDPLVQQLETEIARLWQDPQVKSLFTEKIKQAFTEREPHDVKIDHYRKLHQKSAVLEEEYYDLMRNHFLLRQLTPTLRGMEIARNRIERQTIGQELEELEQPSYTSEGLLSQESADLAALIAYERFKEYHHQFIEEGFIKTPSRQRLLEQILTQTASGTWILLTGETGSGKTQLANTVSRILNNEPALPAGGEERSDVKSLIGTKSLEGDRSGFDFGPLTAAMTGYNNSFELSRDGNPRGRIALIDEINKFNQDALFGSLKTAHNVRPGETFSYKELPGLLLKKSDRGFGLIATRNPATVRYERQDLDPALERLFYNGRITVDYPPMSDTDPELYEMFLGILMDNNGRIRIPQQELAPKFIDVKNEATGIVTQNIDPDSTQHGALYRFALAVSEVHKSFNRQPNIARVGTDEGFLERDVLEMGVLTGWLKEYSMEVEGGSSLTAYLHEKLHDFYVNIASETDKAIFKRIFSHFNLNIDTLPERLPKPPYEALTPLEMGYLTPRTERAVRKIGDEAKPKTKLKILKDGTPIHYLPVPHVIDEKNSYPPETLFDYEGKQYLYLGTDQKTGESIFIPLEKISPGEVSNLFTTGRETPATERRTSKEPKVERAKTLFGEDFLGVEAIRTMEAKCKAAGINVTFEMPNVQLPYSEQQLEQAKKDEQKGKTRMLVLRPTEMIVNGQRQPVTILNLRSLFQGKNPFGSGKMFYDQSWYDTETFAQTPLTPGYALPTKEVVPNSLSKTWDQQTALAESGEKRREAVETVWDLLLYYAATGKKVMERHWDWTQTRSSNGRLVRVGVFGSAGLDLRRWHPDGSDGALGVCLSR